MYLSKQKNRTNQIFALLATLLIAFVYWMVISQVPSLSATTRYILLAIGGLVCFNTYSIFTKKYRERKVLEKTPFPEAWRKVLERYVSFYNALDETEKRHFESEIQVFLHEVRVVGVKTEVDDIALVLTASSAIIPIFSFPEWEYENLGEVLLYPGPFNSKFSLEGEGRNITGMVGTGVMQGVMILSKPALIAGFDIHNDKKNVGIHEFVHLLDAADGSYDGVPEKFMEHQYIAPWLEIIRKETERINDKESKMNPYAATNRVEFFAVASEYFFEHPKALKKNKPELYEMLTRVFQQDTRSRLKNSLRDMMNTRGKQVGRNAACPCGSGKKYKDCCLRKHKKMPC